MSKWTIISIGLVAALLVGVFVFSPLALKPMETDLSLIGAGKPALVLGYENYSPSGADAMDRLSKVKDDYQDRLLFVIAELGNPQGRRFADRYRLGDGIAIFMGPAGEPIRFGPIPADEQELRARIEARLAQVGAR